MCFVLMFKLAAWVLQLDEYSSETLFQINNKGFDTILIGDCLMAGLNHYSKVWYNFFKPLIWERRRGTGGDICIMVSA